MRVAPGISRVLNHAFKSVRSVLISEPL